MDGNFGKSGDGKSEDSENPAGKSMKNPGNARNPPGHRCGEEFKVHGPHEILGSATFWAAGGVEAPVIGLQDLERRGSSWLAKGSVY